MVRPVIRSPGGAWSMAQVRVEAGASEAEARTAVRRGHLPADPGALRARHVLALLVSRHVADLPALRGGTGGRTGARGAGELQALRDREAVAAALSVLDELVGAGGPGAAPLVGEARLVVTASAAVLTRTATEVAAMVGAGNPLPGLAPALLVLPVGQWAQQVAALDGSG